MKSGIKNKYRKIKESKRQLLWDKKRLEGRLERGLIKQTDKIEASIQKKKDEIKEKLKPVVKFKNKIKDRIEKKSTQKPLNIKAGTLDDASIERIRANVIPGDSKSSKFKHTDKDQKAHLEEKKRAVKKAESMRVRLKPMKRPLERRT